MKKLDQKKLREISTKLMAVSAFWMTLAVAETNCEEAVGVLAPELGQKALVDETAKYRHRLSVTIRVVAALI